jgi:diaminopimelate epimerase
MHGIGNDYIYFNCMQEELTDPQLLAINLSDRHFGVGGDGIVLICKSDIADAKMRMFNIDGSEGRMCGNAIRCVGKYLYDNKHVDKLTINIETLSGVKELRMTLDNGLVANVTVDMGKAELSPSVIPVELDLDRIIDYPVIIDGVDYRITCVSMGNPHCVIFFDDVDSLDIRAVGEKFETDKLFPERVNTEFVEVVNENTLKMRVWERGSGETLACGTGACAAAVAAVLNGHCLIGEDIRVILSGGDLIINYTDECVRMTGSANKTFEGVVEL